MKAYLGKILICTVPVVIACVIVGWAFYQYRQEKGGFRLGVDLVGGTILVYQIDPTKPGGSGDKLNELAASLKRRIDPSDLYNVTIRPVPGDPPRVEVILPTGGKGHGEHSLTEEEVEKMRGLIQQQGRLEFRILANTEDDSKATEAAIETLRASKATEAAIETLRASKAAVERARETGDPPPPPSQDAYPVTLFGETSEHRYSWMEIGKEELYNLHLNNAMENDPKYGPNWQFVAEARKKGEAVRTSDFNPRTGTAVVPQLMRCLIYSRTIPPDRMKKLSKEDREAGKKYEYFVLTREESADRGIVEGKHLDSVSAGTGPRNERAVDFTLNSQGAILFADLTTRNRPSSKDENAFKRHLAILLDNMVQSAPTIQTPITGGRGQITLGDSKPEDVETLLRILRAGALPATIIPNPVAQNTMGATLGADTIKKGTYSVVLAFAAVLLFMAVYYRFAGLVACFALLANLILTVAFMVLVSATFTLPGLAGLVLMLGMAVDANILIYERVREERERGASLAMAIRNGYDRAFPTIIDTHLSSIFTAIVLYVVGNDQLKGFGISLTVGLIISLFTSLYITRTIFDIWMGNGWLRDLKFMHLFRRPNFDFMSIRYYWFTATVVLTILGGAIFLSRLDKGGLNIDFVGGTAYGGHLTKPVDLAYLREHLEGKAALPDLSIEQTFIGEGSFGGKSEFFTVRTTERKAEVVQEEINRLLDADLEKVKMDWKPMPPDQEVSQGYTKDRKRGYILTFTEKKEGDPPAYVSLYRVQTMLRKEVTDRAEKAGQSEEAEERAAARYLRSGNFTVEPGGTEPKQEHYNELYVAISQDVPAEAAESILNQVAQTYSSSAQPDRLEVFDSQLAHSTQNRALLAIVLSWGAILLYLWFRFGSWTFGAAAVMCLIHDLFFTLGMIAGAHYLHLYAPWLANALLLQDFKIDFAAVAALLTLVGYSTNDTIVVFDRIREVRGKNPLLTPQMINDSVNQTLSRTVLASLATWLVVVVLYFFGGEGVHLFSFVMVVGVIVGTYSSIYIASPLLLIFGEGVQKKAPVRERQPQPTESA